MPFFQSTIFLHCAYLNELQSSIIGVKDDPFHLRMYGVDQPCLKGQCEVLPLEPAAGGLEREHDIQSRGE